MPQAAGTMGRLMGHSNVVRAAAERPWWSPVALYLRAFVTSRQVSHLMTSPVLLPPTCLLCSAASSNHALVPCYIQPRHACQAGACDVVLMPDVQACTRQILQAQRHSSVEEGRLGPLAQQPAVCGCPVLLPGLALPHPVVSGGCGVHAALACKWPWRCAAVPTATPPRLYALQG